MWQSTERWSHWRSAEPGRPTEETRVTNGPTEAVNNLAKRIKSVAFGLVNFRHHRVRCLLYAGKPGWMSRPGSCDASTLGLTGARLVGSFAERDSVLRARDQSRDHVATHVDYPLIEEQKVKVGPYSGSSVPNPEQVTSKARCGYSRASALRQPACINCARSRNASASSNSSSDGNTSQRWT